MARGIDGEAHRGALDAGGVTVAVLGCGIDRDYPAAHRDLARRIVESGLIVSEYEPGVEPAPWRFPARNRIIAGLCAATVVVEARERSGALITADFALEDGREVMVVPGEITSAVSAGSNALLRLGATPVTAAADVLEAYGIEPASSRRCRPGARGRAARAPGREPGEHRRARPRCRLAPGEVAAALIELELAGRVSEVDGVYRVDDDAVSRSGAQYDRRVRASRICPARRLPRRRLARLLALVVARRALGRGRRRPRAPPIGR